MDELGLHDILMALIILLFAAWVAYTFISDKKRAKRRDDEIFKGEISKLLKDRK